MAAAKRHEKRVGYVRVSTLDQNTERQLEGVKLDKVFTDKVSGKDTTRPQWQAALEYLREGDLLLVHSMDRLARSVDDLRIIVLDLTKKGVQVQFVKENLIFTGEDSPMSNLLLSSLGAVAEFERSMIRERQRVGIELAKKKVSTRGGNHRSRLPKSQRFTSGSRPGRRRLGWLLSIGYRGRHCTRLLVQGKSGIHPSSGPSLLRTTS